jgi:hypothetical protein
MNYSFLRNNFFSIILKLLDDIITALGGDPDDDNGAVE